MNPYHSQITDKYWSDLDIIPRVDDYVNMEELLSEDDYGWLLDNCKCWSGDDAKVMMVTLRKNEEGFYYWIWVEAEDF